MKLFDLKRKVYAMLAETKESEALALTDLLKTIDDLRNDINHVHITKIHNYYKIDTHNDCFMFDSFEEYQTYVIERIESIENTEVYFYDKTKNYTLEQAKNLYDTINYSNYSNCLGNV